MEQIRTLDARLDRWRCLDGTALKLIAMLSMVLDHAGDLFFPEAVWLRVLGRISLPVFAYCVAEGFRHTRDRKRYLLRLGLFALLSELPFDLAREGRLEFTHQNVMLTFFLAVLALLLYEAVPVRVKGRGGRLLACGAVLVIAAVSLLLRTDYSFFAVLLVFLFHVLRGQPELLRQLAALVYELLLRNRGIYAWGVLSFIPLILYNGKKGRGLKWLFYVFYPGHLLLFYLIRRALGTV